MVTRSRWILVLLAWGVSISADAQLAIAASAPAPLVIGQTFTMESKLLKETRRINVYAPPPCEGDKAQACPVLYMPDGGMAEDFLHVAGLVQVSVGNATMRPFIVVGIENTERRRDLTGPTEAAEDRKIAVHVGGSAAFRSFIRDELKPLIRSRYRVTDESAIVGESLAGLFIIETFFLEPDLFDSYIAISPSLWWNQQALANTAMQRLDAMKLAHKALYLTSAGDDILAPIQMLDAALRDHAPANLNWTYAPLPDEHHATIYHPAALAAFRKMFAPPAPEPLPAPTH